MDVDLLNGLVLISKAVSVPLWPIHVDSTSSGLGVFEEWITLRPVGGSRPNAYVSAVKHGFADDLRHQLRCLACQRTASMRLPPARAYCDRGSRLAVLEVEGAYVIGPDTGGHVVLRVWLHVAQVEVEAA